MNFSKKGRKMIKSESVIDSYYVNMNTKDLPSVVLIVVIKLIVDVYWSFHMLVDLQREIHMQNLETRLSKIKVKKKQTNVW